MIRIASLAFFAALPVFASIVQTGIPPVNEALEAARRASARNFAQPEILELWCEGARIWTLGDTNVPELRSGQRVLVRGRGFGAGPDVDYAKLMIGNVRAMERDLVFYAGKADLLKRHFYEVAAVTDVWPSELLRWSSDEIEFRVPETARAGELRVQIQKRVTNNVSLVDSSRPHSVWDPLSERIEDSFVFGSDVVSRLSQPVASNGVAIAVYNSGLASQRDLGEAIFWNYDYNIGMTHHMSGLSWSSILWKMKKDPVAGGTADPEKLFGAIPLKEGEVPSVALHRFKYKAYPMPSPIVPILGFPAPLKSGSSWPTKYVGYSWSEGINPITGVREKHIGFNCASCHAQLIEFESAPGVHVRKVFPGLPNTNWSMKWSVLGSLTGVKGKETNFEGATESIDKMMLIYSMAPGTAEHSLVRSTNETSSPYHSDNLFSPITIPIITRHTPVRRALSRTEMIAGFEGSYIHSEEPDGAVGAMQPASLKALTVYMSTLDEDHETLSRVGLYRSVVKKGMLTDLDGATEGEFVSRGSSSYPKLASKLAHGAETWQKNCLSCHSTNFGTNSDENMVPLSEVGTYFSPTIYNRETQAIRTAIVRDLYWVAGRGLLRDGHVKSVEDLVNPERTRPGTALYDRLYTLNPQTFHVPKGNKEQERATRNHLYFVDVPWDTSALYWDYQKMRREFGPRELGAPGRVDLPATPHPWTAEDVNEIDDLVLYMMTL